MTHILPGPGPNAEPGTMLAGVYVPTLGCWEITGEYRGEKLSFVVWVQPVKQVSLTRRSPPSHAHGSAVATSAMENHFGPYSGPAFQFN